MRRNNLKSLRKFEKLENRWMMAADIDFDEDDGILTIEGTNDRDFIYVEANPEDPSELRAIVTDRTGAVLTQRDFDLDEVNEIVAYGFGGDDYVTNDLMINARFYGGGDKDWLVSAGAQNVLDGGPGDDTLWSQGGDDEMIGGPGNDWYEFAADDCGTDVVNEAASVDTDTLSFQLFIGTVNVNLAATVEQIVNTEYLRLRLTTDTGIENVLGSGRMDTIYGNSRDNVLWGTNDRDLLYGRGGADDLFGGRGNDELYGDAGLDELFGEDGYDDLYGGTERDILRGGIGNDWLYGEAGLDDLFGEDGDDWLFGGGDRDILRGGNGTDGLFGEAGNDDLYGEAGVDQLDGGADSDYLDGGYFPTIGTTVRDQLYGGTGADTFVRHRKRLQPNLRFEDFCDFNSAIDRVFEVWH
jgi:Ca2+-binding RTX toxin-like protein